MAKDKTNIPLNPDGSLKTPFWTFIRLMLSDDNFMPSSARVLGTWIFLFVSLTTGALTGALSWKLVVATDPATVAALVGGIRYLVWIYMILIAAGLSFYGIHVWKYLGQLQAGLIPDPRAALGGFSGMSTPTSPAPSVLPKSLGSTSSTPTPPPSKKTSTAGVGNDDF